MKRINLIILILLCVVSCQYNMSECSDSIELYIQDEIRSIYGKSCSINLSCEKGEVLIEIKNMPDYKTGKDYNQLLLSHLFYKVHSFHDKITSNVKLRVKHSNLEVSDYYHSIRANQLLEDYKIKNYERLVKNSLSVLGDEETAYFALSMEEARKLYPDSNTQLNLIDLLVFHCIENQNEENRDDVLIEHIEFEMKLFFWVSQFDYGNLSFNREKLRSLFDVLGLKFGYNWSKSELNTEYSQLSR